MLHPQVSVQQDEVKLSNMFSQKVLLNGEIVIQYHVYTDEKEGSFFSSRNTLLIVLTGTVRINHGSDQHTVSSGQFAFVKSKIVCEYICVEEENGFNSEIVFFNLSYDLIKEFSLLANLPAAVQIDKVEIMISKLNSYLVKYMDTISTCLYSTQIADSSFMKIKLFELLFILRGSYPEIASRLLEQRKSFRPDITAVVEENVMNPLSIQQLAVLAGRSLSSFKRDFLSTYNMPPSQWIREKRLKKAKDFLVSTNMTITDICYTLGFENIAHFSRLFKSQFGHSPTAYRLQSVPVQG